jgi:two-component system phosphate regulon response regulator OmpR
MSLNATLLVVDDEPELREVLTDYFVAQGCTIYSADRAAAARALAAEHRIDGALVDVTMPGEDGLSLARHLRERYQRMGIVMLTGAGTVLDRVVGLEVGADDYVTKPFEPRELLARVKAVLRRTATPANAAAVVESDAGRVRVGRCTLDRAARLLIDETGKEVPLTALEFRLLQAFTAHPNHVLSRERILNLNGNQDWDPYDRSVDVRILRLRRKIEPDPEHPRYIRTVSGGGYKFDPEGAEH